MTKRVWRDAFGRFTAPPKRGTGELRPKPKVLTAKPKKRKPVKPKPESRKRKAPKTRKEANPFAKARKPKPVKAKAQPKPVKVPRTAKPRKAKPTKPKAKPTPKLIQQRNRKTGQFQKAWIPADIEWVDPFPLGNHKRNGSYSRNYSRVRFHEDAARLHRSLEIRSELGRAELERAAQDMAEELGVHVNEVYSFFLSW